MICYVTLGLSSFANNFIDRSWHQLFVLMCICWMLCFVSGTTILGEFWIKSIVSVLSTSLPIFVEYPFQRMVTWKTKSCAVETDLATSVVSSEEVHNLQHPCLSTSAAQSCVRMDLSSVKWIFSGKTILECKYWKYFESVY